MLHRLHAILLALMLALAPCAGFASQNALSSPTGGTVSGLQLTNNYNSAIDSVNTCNSGGSAPSNQLSGVPSLGNCWWKTGDNSFNYFEGTSWVPLGWFDTASHYWQGLTGGGAVNTVASSGTTDLCSTKPTTLKISGVTTITSFGSNCQVGQLKKFVFTGALTLTHNGTSLILPNGGGNITTAAGDIAEAVYLGAGNWQVLDYTLANGQPLNTSAVAVGSSSLLASAQGYNVPLNLKLVASIAGNALTIAVKGTNGSDPSSVNPVLIGFRDTTLVNGEMIVDSLQSALSFTVNSGNTMGATNGAPFRLYVFAFDNGGSVVLSLINCANATFVCAEDQLQNTAAGTTGGNSTGVFYSNSSALSGKAVRVLGYLDYTSGLGTAGTWNALPTKVQLFGPGVRRPDERAPTVQLLNSGAGATYTTPAGVAYLRVQMCAGGGGGGQAGGGSAGSAGGDTSFGTGTTIHGAGGAANGGAGGVGGTGGVDLGTLVNRVAGGTGQYGMGSAAANANGLGGMGGASVFGGAGAGANASGGVSARANSCAGGGGAGAGSAANGGAGGGAGEYAEFLIVSPAATYVYTIGAGGGASTGGTGAAGKIIVLEAYN